MKKIAGVLSVALALGAAPLSAGFGHQTMTGVTISAVVPALAAFKDEPDNEEGDDEGGVVVDPRPQDDGSDGVDDGSGDA